MIKMYVYVDGPTIPNRTDIIKFAFLYETALFTPGNITEDGVVVYRGGSLELTNLKAGATTISPIVFLNNINKFTYSSGGVLTFQGGSLEDNRKISNLDQSIPLSCLRANTVVSLGRL